MRHLHGKFGCQLESRLPNEMAASANQIIHVIFSLMNPSFSRNYVWLLVQPEISNEIEIMSDFWKFHCIVQSLTTRGLLETYYFRDFVLNNFLMRMFSQLFHKKLTVFQDETFYFKFYLLLVLTTNFCQLLRANLQLWSLPLFMLWFIIEIYANFLLVLNSNLWKNWGRSWQQDIWSVLPDCR